MCPGYVRANSRSKRASDSCGTLKRVSAPRDVTLDELADAYWENWRLSDSSDHAERLRKEEVFWAWGMVDAIVCGRTWDDWDAEEERREPRLPPTIERLALIEFLAE